MSGVPLLCMRGENMNTHAHPNGIRAVLPCAALDLGPRALHGRTSTHRRWSNTWRCSTELCGGDTPGLTSLLSLLAQQLIDRGILLDMDTHHGCWWNMLCGS